MWKINIQARIIARKVAFSFIYSHLILFNTNKKYINLFEEQSEKKESDCFFCFDFKQITNQYVDEIWEYIIKEFFSYKKQPVVDFKYYQTIALNFWNYIKETQENVNKLTNTFQMERMDFCDQSIFVLAYTEYKTLQTEKKILINEMVELAKRYWDIWSPKLINWILDKLIKN